MKQMRGLLLSGVLAVLVLAAAFGAPGPQGEAPPSSGAESASSQRGDTPPPIQDTPAPPRPQGDGSAPPEGTLPAPSPEDGEPEEPAPAPEEPDKENPEPAEPEDAAPPAEEPLCTLSISCATVLDHMDQLDGEKSGLIPENGWILAAAQVPFTEGESVFDLLQRVCRQEGIHMEFSTTPLTGSAYLEGIHNLYEFDCGPLSGWVYCVNGWFPNYGCSQYVLQDGDTVAWLYTCDLGEDVGGRNVLEG